MKNFKNALSALNWYCGSCPKEILIFEGKKYLVKKRCKIRNRGNQSTFYSANIYSEDIGCKIYKALGIDAQNTFLCKCLEKGKEITCCACKDFNDPPCSLTEFKSIYISEIPSSSKYERNPYPSLEEIQRIYRTAVPLKDHPELEERFWDMILVDTLINNQDRRLDTWGFLIELQHGIQIRLAPVYDCDFAFSSWLSDQEIADLLKDPSLMQISKLDVRFPFFFKSKRVTALELYEDPPDGLKRSVLRITPKIKEKSDRICKIVEGEEELSPGRKNFMIESMKLRYVKFLEPCFEKIS